MTPTVDNIRETVGIVLPDTTIVAEAIELAYTDASPMLFNHVMRSALFAALFAAQRSDPVDNELLAIAAVLHDLGFCPSHAHDDLRFEIRSANAARKFAQDRNLCRDRSWRLWDMIALHTHDLNLFRRDEDWALQMGILADVVGAGLETLDKQSVDRIVTRFPRHDFKRGFYQLLCSEVGKGSPPPQHPSTMIAYHERRDFVMPDARDLIHSAPFKE